MMLSLNLNVIPQWNKGIEDTLQQAVCFVAGTKLLVMGCKSKREHTSSNATSSLATLLDAHLAQNVYSLERRQFKDDGGILLYLQLFQPRFHRPPEGTKQIQAINFHRVQRNLVRPVIILL